MALKNSQKKKLKRFQLTSSFHDFFPLLFENEYHEIMRKTNFSTSEFAIQNMISRALEEC